MYRLLIVTDDPNVQNMFTAMQGWEAMGIKPPRLRSTVEEAVECMHKHHIDAIAVDASPAFETLYAYLDEHYPDMPIFTIEADADAQLQTVREVYRLLTRLGADDSNDEYDDAHKLEVLRERWLHKVVSGMIPTESVLERELKLYRCTERANVPCVLARLSLPTDDTFLAERWHYGSERLETALGNFFGREREHMLLHIAVVSQQEVRVLCYPLCAQEGVRESVVRDVILETVEQIENYLGLALQVLDVRRLDGLAAFTAERNAL